MPQRRTWDTWPPSASGWDTCYRSTRISGSSPELAVDGRGTRVALVVGSWHEQITEALLAGAMRALDAAGNSEREVLRVPGAFELPLGAKQAFERGFDYVVALGVVIRGDTPHFDYVCRGATDGLMRVMLDYGKPVGFGLLTVDDEAQALARVGLPGSSEDKGAEAAQAALAMVRPAK